MDQPAVDWLQMAGQFVGQSRRCRMRRRKVDRWKTWPVKSQKRDEVRKLDIASDKFISSKYCADYPCVFTADSDFMGKYAKYTKYEKLPQTISNPLVRPQQPLEVTSLFITVSIDHIFNLL